VHQIPAVVFQYGNDLFAMRGNRVKKGCTGIKPIGDHDIKGTWIVEKHSLLKACSGSYFVLTRELHLQVQEKGKLFA